MKKLEEENAALKELMSTLQSQLLDIKARSAISNGDELTVGTRSCMHAHHSPRLPSLMPSSHSPPSISFPLTLLTHTL
jgi:hypothetical protein